VVGADGLNSLVRSAFPDSFKPTMEYFENRFAWFGATIPFDTLTQTFIETEFGPMNAHHYRFEPDRSTFIVECEEATFQKAGFEALGEDESADRCSALFADALKGTKLVTNKSMWRRFPRLWCENWVAGNHVLLGDAVHTAHFSIGSGTRLAMEDAIALVEALAGHPSLEEALAAYQEQRPPVARKIVDAANTSATWYESFGEKMRLAPMDFAYDYLMRSGRMTEERLRQVAPRFAADYAAHRAMAK
jgi:2-polyprenyl-6-methoxyphenol hydroxylase-like FAD-dependent oxidoreductase